MAKLEAGAKAPAFTLPDADGKKVSLSSFAGQKVVVYFYPKDDTPGCTKEACQFNDALTQFEGLGVPVIGISPTAAASHVSFRDKYGLQLRPPVRPRAHRHGEVRRVGPEDHVRQATTGVIRSTFLIDEKGKIARAWYSVKADGHAAKVLEEVLSEGDGG